VAKHQTYGALLVLLIAAIVTGVSHYFKEPSVRPLPAYDPTISLPYATQDTVPMAEAAGEIGWKWQLQQGCSASMLNRSTTVRFVRNT
jgi:hypothetical protein